MFGSSDREVRSGSWRRPRALRRAESRHGKLESLRHGGSRAAALGAGHYNSSRKPVEKMWV